MKRREFMRRSTVAKRDDVLLEFPLVTILDATRSSYNTPYLWLCDQEFHGLDQLNSIFIQSYVDVRLLKYGRWCLQTRKIAVLLRTQGFWYGSLRSALSSGRLLEFLTVDDIEQGSWLYPVFVHMKYKHLSILHWFVKVWGIYLIAFGDCCLTCDIRKYRKI